MEAVRIGTELIKIEDGLIFLDFEFVNFDYKVGEEDFFRVFRVFVGNEFFNVVFCDFEIVILVDTVEHKLKYAFVIHKTEDCDS